MEELKNIIMMCGLGHPTDAFWRDMIKEVKKDRNNTIDLPALLIMVARKMWKKRPFGTLVEKNEIK